MFTLLITNPKLNWAWWCTPVILVAQEAEAGGSQVQRQTQDSATTHGPKQLKETVSK